MTLTTPLLFSTMEVTKQAFYRTAHSYAIVNLKPIMSGHVLVIPTRVVPRLTDLTTPELTSLMSSIQYVGRVIEKAYDADSLTVACQDGKAAGQSVPHVHFHILPRKFKGDYFSERMDDIYPALERSEASLHQHSVAVDGVDNRFQPLKLDVDEDRQPRSVSDMEMEAEWLRTFLVNPLTTIHEQG